jgi:hypothetical protein
MSDSNPPVPLTANGKKSPRFQKGNKASKGWPWQKHVKEYREAIFTCITRDDMIALAKNTLRIALNSEPSIALKATDMLWKYGGVKPPEQTELTLKSDDSVARIKALKDALNITDVTDTTKT